MKTKFSLSIIAAALLLTSTVVFAISYEDSIPSKEAKALNNPQGIKSEAAQAQVEEFRSKEAFLTKVTAGIFQKEATQDEAKRVHKVANSVVQTHKNSIAKAPQEFMSGLNDTLMALQAIKAGKNDEAEKFLKNADKEFKAAFKKEPKLGLIPVRDNVTMVSFNGGPKLIKEVEDTAVKLLINNDIQAAIDILTPLQDELVINTQYVPAYLYPKAVKEAAKELKSGKKDVAFGIIITALDASQIDTIIIPIPLVTAEDLILEASKLDKSNKKEALRFLTMAQTELQKAVLLGYTHKYQKSYKLLDEKIQKIQTEIKGKNVVVKFYEELLKDFKNLGNKHKTDVKHTK